MATPRKDSIIKLHQLLNEVCFELNLDSRQDKHIRDYIISKDGVYLFRATFNAKHSFFGVRFAAKQTCDFTYNLEKVKLLVDKLMEERGKRKVSLGMDYSRDNHI